MEVKNQEKAYSVKEVLGITINRLASIQIPIVAIDTVGAPIQDAIQKLEACIQAITADEKPTAKNDAENLDEEMAVSMETEPIPEDDEHKTS